MIIFAVNFKKKEENMSQLYSDQEVIDVLIAIFGGGTISPNVQNQIKNDLANHAKPKPAEPIPPVDIPKELKERSFEDNAKANPAPNKSSGVTSQLNSGV